MRVIERQRAHYETVEVPYGKMYGWRQEYSRIQCDCGGDLAWNGKEGVCSCGAVYLGEVWELDDRDKAQDGYPWSGEYKVWREKKLANNLRREYYEYAKTRDGG